MVTCYLVIVCESIYMEMNPVTIDGGLRTVAIVLPKCSYSIQLSNISKYL